MHRQLVSPPKISTPTLYAARAVLQGYTAYSAVLYIMVAVTWCSLAACGWVGWRFHQAGVVPNKW
jgi:hypothetical protein